MTLHGRFTSVAPALLLPGTLVVHLLGIAAPDRGRLPDADRPIPQDGKELYEIACADCHGIDGRGADPSTVAFDVPVPDFTECSFSSREPDADWIAVAHAGGPVRAFDDAMPAFGDALSGEQLQAIMDYIRDFCGDDSWPRGELNLPRPLITEKAYPEDEAVTTMGVNLEGAGAVVNQLVYEKRFGARSQLEVKVPFGLRESAVARGDWKAGIGDITAGVKHTIAHNLESGSIFSVGGEAKFPTGDDDNGFGTGVTVMEAFVAYGQILPREAFLHVQGILEFPTGDNRDIEAVWRAALGRSFAQPGFGRTWTPMVEVLGEKELDGGSVHLDVVPQLQVTLNTRQHVMANVGVRFPVNDTSQRPTQLLVYILWDWFDGGFFDGW